MRRGTACPPSRLRRRGGPGHDRRRTAGRCRDRRRGRQALRRRHDQTRSPSGSADLALTACSAPYQAVAGDVPSRHVARRNVVANLVCRQRATATSATPKCRHPCEASCCDSPVKRSRLPGERADGDVVMQTDSNRDFSRWRVRRLRRLCIDTRRLVRCHRPTAAPWLAVVTNRDLALGHRSSAARVQPRSLSLLAHACDARQAPRSR